MTVKHTKSRTFRVTAHEQLILAVQGISGIADIPITETGWTFRRLPPTSHGWKKADEKPCTT